MITDRGGALKAADRRADVPAVTGSGVRASERPAVNRRRPASLGVPATIHLSDVVLEELRHELEQASTIDDVEKCMRARLRLSGVHAVRGEWREAYQELRAAVELERAPDLRAEIVRLQRETDHARWVCMRDDLTETFNRRYLDRALTPSPGPRARPAASVALVDLDHFKAVNDTWGHGVGDLVLQQVAQLLCHDLPAGAFCARYGGEEFALVLPDVDLDAAVELCDGVRTRVEQHDWRRIADGLRVTVSVGVAPADGSPNQLQRADALLYEAKRSGRNRVASRR